jgi:L-lactate dehydrogenase complex protein LldF
MNQATKHFALQSKQACEATEKRSILKKNLHNYSDKFEYAKEQFSDYEMSRKKLHYLKYKSIESIEKNLSEFETHFSTRGGKVIYASHKEDALKYIHEIIKETRTNKIVKSKSMVCEELELDDYLNSHEIKVIESDLGEFIVQLAGEKSSHITAPALHKSKEEIYQLLNEQYNTSFHSNTPVEHIVDFVRKIMREELNDVKVGITGCNFLIADVGAIAISENEANAILSSSIPPVHIVVTSIEKVVSQFANLELFQSMLSTHATGQKLTAYNHIFFGPYKNADSNVHPKMYVIIVDNKRSQLLKNIQLREACYCIKCGACHNVCPVYKIIGGHTYDSVYNGPIGSVISPVIIDNEKYTHLPFASTLCGKCNDVCPAKINLTGLLIESRKNIVHNKMNSATDRFVFNKVHYFLMKRNRMDSMNSTIKNIGLQIFLKKNWGLHRELPVFSKQSFNKKQKNKAT